MTNYQNNTMPEYDLSMLDEITNKEFNFNEVVKEMLFYLLPIFSFAFFLSITFLAIFPKVEEINTELNNIDTLKVEVTALDQRIADINQLNVNAVKNEDVINKINTIVPTGQTEVVKFGQRIKAALNLNAIQNKLIVSGESVLVSQENATAIKTTNTAPIIDENVLSLKEIPSKFDIKGDYESIRTFFTQLYKSDDFFVVDSMSLKKTDTTSWAGEVSLAKYQFSESLKFDPIVAYGTISEKIVFNETVIKFLEAKFIDNVFENTPVTPTN